MTGRSAPFLAAAIAFFAAALPLHARADGAPGVDEVDLKNGGMLRGTIIALEPDKQVIILLAPTGESRTVPWAEVSKVERGKFAPAPAPAPAPVAAPSVPELGPGSPRVHIDADKPGVALQRITFTLGMMGYGTGAYGVASEVVCRAPCDRIVDAHSGHDFFFGGEGITPSRRFQLTDMGGDLTAEVSAGSAAQRVTGMVLSFAGGGFTLGGGLLLPLSLAFKKSAMMSGTSTSSGSSFPVIAGSVLGVGAAMLIIGTVCWATSGTSYTLHPKGGGPIVTGRRLRFSGGALLF